MKEIAVAFDVSINESQLMNMPLIDIDWRRNVGVEILAVFTLGGAVF